ncbi:MAG TPA: PIG-L family deacetylase, partial [Gemmatimonadota bacterium]|nr:PIG-L family deacetylase [Gemmatimonadota bacterium]
MLTTTTCSGSGPRGARAGRATPLGLLLLALALVLPSRAWAQEAPYRGLPVEGGAVETGLLLRQLGGVKRVLVIAAHPDDEDSALLAELARRLGVRAAYMALTRGEGGQDLIGPELGKGLGLIRTGELLAARRIDGATQYFSRAYDFGYSKTA